MTRLRIAILLLVLAPAAAWAGNAADQQAKRDVRQLHEKYSDFYNDGTTLNPNQRSCRGYPPVDCTPPVSPAFAHCCPVKSPPVGQ